MTSIEVTAGPEVRGKLKVAENLISDPLSSLLVRRRPAQPSALATNCSTPLPAAEAAAATEDRAGSPRQRPSFKVGTVVAMIFRRFENYMFRDVTDCFMTDT